MKKSGAFAEKTDTNRVRTLRLKLITLLLCLVFLAPGLYAYKILYAEQLYRLYHLHYYQYPERTAENIGYLQSALKADFANPLYALAKIPDAKHWERYRYLFTMHVNLKLIELYLSWGAQYMKMTAYFYNAPWQRENLESLDRAEDLFRYALAYWDEAKRWSTKAGALRFLHMEEIQYWEDENHRIETGDLDYRDIIEEHLEKIARVRAAFKAMDANTY
jgi:hypothetical protein